MAIQIDSMQTQMNIMPSAEGGERNANGNQAGTSSPALSHNIDQLKEVLRPLVMELISEELESYMRMRG